MAYQRGDVVRAGAPFSTAEWRPWLVISNGTHPFHGNEYIAVLVTTTQRDKAIAIEEEHFEEGGLPYRSYINPWNPITLKDEAIQTRQATVDVTLADQASRELRDYTK